MSLVSITTGPVLLKGHMLRSLFGSVKTPDNTNAPKAIDTTTGKRKTTKAVFCTAIL
jgi:hypothetical protein